MKIGIIAAPYIPVPPKIYGGAERRIHALGKGLLDKGLDVTLFASGDSPTTIPLKPICNVALSKNPDYNPQKNRVERVNKINNETMRIIGDDLDIINVHDYENIDLIDRLSKRKTPILVSIRHSLNPIVREVYNMFKDNQNVNFHGVSRNQIQLHGLDVPFIYHGEDPSVYEAVNNLDEKRPYFLSIGNVRSSKGHTVAINLAKKIGIDLVISAGSLYYPAEEAYFENVIKPRVDVKVYDQKEAFLRDIEEGTHRFGKGRIINFGPSDDSEKRILYKHALFTQFLGNLEQYGNADACPGVVLESLLSGTPILGVRGSVTEEMVRENLAGINVSSINEAQLRLKEILSLDPSRIRSFAIENYSSGKIANQYIQLYKKVINSKKDVLVS